MKGCKRKWKLIFKVQSFRMSLGFRLEGFRAEGSGFRVL